MSKILLVDGHSILNRAYYGIPLLSNAQGEYTNAVYGFLNILFKVLDEEKPEFLAVAFDVHAPTFRHEMYKEYKGTRHAMPQELVSQVPLTRDLLKAMGILVLEKPGFEADDILGTLARIYEDAGQEVSILSGDRDLLQLATQKVKVRIPKTKGGTTQVEDYYAQDVVDKYGVTPTEFIELKALMGDTSDNIPGVPGIGEKTASKIISAWHTIEEAYAHAEEIKPKKASQNLQEYYDTALFSRILVTIRTDCPLDFDLEDARIGNLLNTESYQIMKRLELNNILSRFEEIPENTGVEDRADVICLSDGNSLQMLADACQPDDVLGIFCVCGGDEGLEAAAVSGISLNHTQSQDSEVKSESVYILMPGNGITVEDLQDTVRRIIQRAGQVWFNDLKGQLSWLGIADGENLFDAGVAAYLLNPLADSYSCDSIAQVYLGETIPSRGDLFKKQKLGEAVQEEREKVLAYLAQEADIPRRVSSILLRKLEEEGMDKLFCEIEMPVLFVLHEMEEAGICVEKEELAAYGESLTGRIDELEQDIYDLAGESFNINSPRQLGVILFEKMNLPYGKKTKTGYSTAADVLEKLRPVDPIIGKILEYRQLTKLKSTYADGLAAFIRPDDGRIHCKFNQTITATGRLSSADPNLQNIPVRMELGRMIRKVFVPGEGKIFVNADYSQIELRVLAHMAGDENLIRAYQEDQDIHRITASKVFHVPLDEVTSLQRSNAKAVNFGIVYGISSFGLSQDLGISRQEAQEYISQYFVTYPGIKQYLDQCVQQAKETGYAVTLYGRKRPVPELASKNFMQRSFGERAAMNSPIQGTAADIIKIAMVRVSRALKAQSAGSRLILQIHDELLIEALPEEEELVRKILKEEMEQAAALSVPLEVEMNSGENWYALK